MKSMVSPREQSIVLLSYFAVAILGEGLPPDSIPINCATICGPMVELTSKCSPRSATKNLRFRRLDHNSKGAIVKPQGLQVNEGRASGGGVKGRDFTLIVPAPASFPPTLLIQESTTTKAQQNIQTAHNLPQSAQTTLHLRPFPAAPIPANPAAPPPPPPPPPQPAPGANLPSTSRQPSSHVNQEPSARTSSVPPAKPSLAGGDNDSRAATAGPQPTRSQNRGDQDQDGDDDGDQDNAASTNSPTPDRWNMSQDGEQQCVCLNQSFDVAQVAALCSSCIAIATQLQNSTSLSDSGDLP